MNAPLITADAAADELGVRLATLYAYVSRGMVRAEVDPSDPRKRLYNARDIRELARRRQMGKRPAEIAAATLDQGLAILTSSITLLDGERLLYRGRDVVEWATTATLEDTARLLWDCKSDPFAEAAPAVTPNWPQMMKLAVSRPMAERVLLMLSQVPAVSVVTWQRDPASLMSGAAGLLRATVAAVTGSEPRSDPIHLQLARAWSVDRNGSELLRQALSLSSDYELNAAAFGVRVVASTGASLAASLSAGLAAYGGPLHSGQLSLIETLFDEVERVGNARHAVEMRLARGDRIPHFGLQLYEGGDPRARALRQMLPDDPQREEFEEAIVSLLGKQPNLNFTLVALQRALGLPAGTAASLFLVGRTVGWIAHALEQQSQDKPIRPRAQYVAHPAEQ